MGSHSMSNRDLKICLFYCSNCCDQDRLSECCAKVGIPATQMIGLPCSGKVNLPYLVKAFEKGADGVLIVTCRRDECKNLEGNLRSEKRSQAVDSLLGEIGMGQGRVATAATGDNLEEICTQLEALCGRLRQSQPSAKAPAQPGSEGRRPSKAAS
jgi:coenzyme F420-reducing hydrogenase delta subunit